MLAPIAEVQYDGPARRRLRVVVGQHARDVFVRDAVESVAQHAAFRDRLWKCKPLGDRRLVAMERGIEARDLGNAGVRSRIALIGARLCGWCSGASGTYFSRARMIPASMRTGFAYSGPP
jgi:hypothetical protein